MPPDPAKISDTKGWLAKAVVDIRAAEHDQTASPPITADISRLRVEVLVLHREADSIAMRFLKFLIIRNLAGT